MSLLPARKKTPRNDNEVPMGIDELHSFLKDRIRRLVSVSGFHKTLFEGWAQRLHYIDGLIAHPENDNEGNQRNLHALRAIAQEEHDQHYQEYLQFQEVLVSLNQKVKDIELLRLKERHSSKGAYPKNVEDISLTTREVRAIIHQVDALIELRTDNDTKVLEA